MQQSALQIGRARFPGKAVSIRICFGRLNPQLQVDKILTGYGEIMADMMAICRVFAEVRRFSLAFCANFR